MTGLSPHLRSRLFGARRATMACESRNGISTTYRNGDTHVR